MRLVPTEERPGFHVEHRGTSPTRETVIPQGGRDVLEAMRNLKAAALAESHRLRVEARAECDPPRAQSVTAWSTSAHCPGCGGKLDHVTSGSPGPDTRAIAGCPGCGRRWSITASIRDVTADLGRYPRAHPHPEGCTCAAHRSAS